MPDVKNSAGMEGTHKGDIQTPMTAVNAGKSGSGNHAYSGMPSAQGGTSIDGPGAHADWDTQVSIKGSNLKGNY